jgi:hypothetical protein
VRFPSAEDADGLQPRTEPGALSVAGGAAAETVLADELLGVAVAVERLELFDELEAAVRRLAALGTVCPRRALPAARFRGADLPAECCLVPVSGQLVSVTALPLPGTGSCVVDEFFVGGQVGVIVPPGAAEAWAAPVVVVAGGAPEPVGPADGVAVLAAVLDARGVAASDVVVVVVGVAPVAVVGVVAVAAAVVVGVVGAPVSVAVAVAVAGAVVTSVVVGPAGAVIAACAPSAVVAPVQVVSAVDIASVLARIDKRGRPARRLWSVRRSRPMRDEPGRRA